MDFDADEDTVVRVPGPPAVVDSAAAGDAEREDDSDADTVIKERKAFADVPAAAFAQLRTAGLETAEFETAAPEKAEQQTSDLAQAPAYVQPAVPADKSLISTLPLDYSFRINTGDPVRLDTAAVLGRNPALPRIMQGRPPRLIRVPSPLREVSNTHVELRQQGALVIVTDLRTTNGSVVRVPGRASVTLRQGESIVVMPGTVIEIGDGNVVEILSVQRAGLIKDGLTDEVRA